MKTTEEITGMFWHSVAAHLHEAMSTKWLTIEGISNVSGVPEKQIEAMLSGVPQKREPRISDVIEVMAVFNIAPEIDVFQIDDIYAVKAPSSDERQLSILDVLGQGWTPEGDRDD
jgi:hypothetical protein